MKVLFFWDITFFMKTSYQIAISNFSFFHVYHYFYLLFFYLSRQCCINRFIQRRSIVFYGYHLSHFLISGSMDQLIINLVQSMNVPSQLLTLYCMSPGSFCDLKFRPVVEVVDDFRSISLTLTASHFKSAADLGTLGRVEMLPISWHEALHSEESGTWVTILKK